MKYITKANNNLDLQLATMCHYEDKEIPSFEYINAGTSAKVQKRRKAKVVNFPNSGQQFVNTDLTNMNRTTGNRENLDSERNIGENTMSRKAAETEFEHYEKNFRHTDHYYEEPFGAEAEEDAKIPFWIPVAMIAILALTFLLQI